jgi:hypothetical protein
MVTYDSITMLIELPHLNFKYQLKRKAIAYNGKYVNYFGLTPIIITEDKKLIMFIDSHGDPLAARELVIREVQLPNLPDAIYPMYYSCVLEYKGIYRLYTEDIIGKIIDPPLYDIHAFGSHYLYSYSGNGIQITGITRDISSPQWNEPKFPIGNVKRIFPLNIPFIVQTHDNKYYLNFLHMNVDYNILGTIYKPSGYDWVSIPELDRLGSVDLIYLFNVLYVWSNGKTYSDKTILDGLYTVTTNLPSSYKLYESVRIENRKYLGFHDLEIITVL